MKKPFWSIALSLLLIATPVMGQTTVKMNANGAPNGAVVPLGATTDAKCAATDSTAEGVVCLLKQVSYLLSLIPTDAAIGATLTSNPVPSGCKNETTPTVIGNNQAGVVHCDVNQILLTSVKVPSGGIASGGVASGAFAVGSISDGADVALGAKADAANPAVDTTAITAMSVFKELSKLLQGSWAGGTLKAGAVTTAMTGTTTTSVIAGVGSNYLYIQQCTTSNASLTVSTDIILQDGSGGTTLYNLPAPAAAVATTGGGGGTFVFPSPLKVPTIGNGLFAANVTTGSSTKISCSGFASTVSY